MLKTIWLKTIRDSWRAALAWGLGLGLLIYATAAGYVLLYPTAAGRKAAMHDLGPLLNTLRFVGGELVDISTAGGYTTFRILGITPVALGIWAVLAATSATRGEEQRGATDMLLATPHNRANVLIQKWLGFSLALLAITLLFWLVVAAVWPAIGEPFDPGAALLMALNVGLQAWLWGSLAFLLVQFFSSAAAAGITIALMVYSFFLNNLAGIVGGIDALAPISPFHYYAINKPLVPGWPFDPLAFAIAPLLALLFFAAALYFFSRRDLGALFPLLGQRRGSLRPAGPLDWRERLLGSVFLRGLRDLRWPTLFWALGLALYSALIVAIAPQAVDALKSLAGSSGPIASFFKNKFDAQTYIAISLFSFLPVLAAAFAITQVASWTSDEEDGRDELLLTTPQQRWSVMLQRFAAIVVAIIVILVVVGFIINLTAAIVGIGYDAGKMWAAMFTLIPLTLLVVTLGFAIAAWLKQPGTAVAILSVFVIASYLDQLLGQLFKFPALALNLSIFQQYGQPAITGLDAASVSWLSGAMLVLLAVALFGFQRRDLAKG